MGCGSGIWASNSALSINARSRIIKGTSETIKTRSQIAKATIRIGRAKNLTTKDRSQIIK